ncbi:MAG: hypothetical protein NVS3B26_07560 [Mycobacteriales bacterium]
MDDIEAIKQLSARYNRAFDYLDEQSYLDVWTEDGFFERSNAGRSYSGHAELAELLSTFGVNGRHVVTDFIIEVKGDTATQSAYLTYLDADAGYKIAIFGIYSDELVRVDGAWKFASRRLKVD